MADELLLLAASFAIGLAVQRWRRAEPLRNRAWTVYFWTLTPTLVFYAFSTVSFDRELALALAAAILASWLVIGLGLLYGTLASRERDERGALALGASFPNTGFVGYPLAQIAFGAPGLALMVIYDRLAMLGISLPLERAAHEGAELRRAAGALAIRFAVAPLVLLACGLALGVRVPGAFVLAAAMPCAFHLLILARVFDVRPQLMRLLVVASTVPAVIAVVAGKAVL